MLVIFRPVRHQRGRRRWPGQDVPRVKVPMSEWESVHRAGPRPPVLGHRTKVVGRSRIHISRLFQGGDLAISAKLF